MIFNLTKKVILSHNTVYAISFVNRSLGMILRRFDNFDAMVFSNCNAIHTMFMMMKIDVVFVDKENKVSALYHNLRPWLPLVRSKTAYSVIELPKGTIERLEIEVGDLLDLNVELSDLDSKKKFKEEFIQMPETVMPCSESEK